ncbi:recombination regulator RecX [Streptomyces cyaneochromogenes]|uniref:Regulatory protein RecX n=1 Tax=Streptomyces cyaneochromogenes TaxID=2496836 RepID=A0A3Q9ES68_9ACTN|nr:recombination regulator RecX [Streptomyces cyaneochromogenes]AZQ37859.1 recombination regulator RecX [Streptomyces cyaneochromogenes]
MTRRTDWAEYAAYPDAPLERGKGGDEGSSRMGGDVYGGDTAHDTDGGSGGTRPYGTSTRASYGGFQGESGLAYDDGPGRTYGDGSGHGAVDGEAWPEDGSVLDAEGGAPRGGSRRGRGGARYRGSEGSGGSRGRRRRGRTEPSGEDGGASSSSRAEERTPPGDPVEQARAICLRLLTGTPRTRKQLADALRKREIPDDAAEEVLSRFEEVGLINDSAFADAWVESRHHGRGLARRALARELRTKGVDSTLIDAAVAQLDSEQEEATARELVARKLGSTRGLDRDKRLRRLAGMLARKGYPEGMALRVVRQALEEEGEDTEFLEDEGF